jgi:hypothetical protein
MRSLFRSDRWNGIDRKRIYVGPLTGVSESDGRRPFRYLEAPRHGETHALVSQTSHVTTRLQDARATTSTSGDSRPIKAPRSRWRRPPFASPSLPGLLSSAAPRHLPTSTIHSSLLLI